KSKAFFLRYQRGRARENLSSSFFLTSPHLTSLFHLPAHDPALRAHSYHTTHFKPPYSRQTCSTQPHSIYLSVCLCLLLQLFLQALSWSVGRSTFCPLFLDSSWPSNYYPPATQALFARYSSLPGSHLSPSSSTPYFPVRNLHNQVLGSLGTTPPRPPSVCSHVLAPNDPSSLHTVSTTNTIPN
ncbi:hypothetical protein BKA64DRAFT_588060, partial [Cadophora sp. MPI-SDFR-AT-0126]